MLQKPIRTKFKPSRPLVDMLNAGVISGSVFHYGCGKGVDLEYIQLVKPNTIVSGYDPEFSPKLPSVKHDTVFCSYIINYIQDPDEILFRLSIMLSKLKPTGTLIMVARSIAEVKGNVLRNDKWKSHNHGYMSDSGVFQRGYDTLELETIIKLANLEIVTSEYDIGPVPYSYVIARRKIQTDMRLNNYLDSIT